MRVYYILFIFINVFLNSAISQTFEKIIRTEQDDYCFDAIEVGNTYIFPKITGNYFQGDNISSLIVLDKEGNNQQSFIFPDYEGYFDRGVKNIFKQNDSLFYCIREVRNITNNDLQLNLLIVSFEGSSLELQFDTIYGNENISESIYDFKFTSDNKILGAGRHEPDNQNALVIEIDLNDFTFNSWLYYVPEAILASTIMDLPEKNIYHVFMYWDNNNTILEINKSTMEIDTIYQYPEGFFPRNTMSGISDSSYFAVGKKGQEAPGINYVPSFIEVGYNGQIYNIFEYEVHPDTNSYYTSLSFDHKFDNIFFGATYNFTLTLDFPYFPQRRWIFINKLNNDGSILWQRFYKGEVNYMPYKVLATNDGGALIFSTKCDWNDTIPLQLDLHILKIDSTGWYNGLPAAIDEFSQMKQILVYPNPVKNYLNIALGLYTDINLQIFDTNGQIILVKNLKYSQKIDLPELPTGFYIYVLTGKNGFVEKGKLIKE